MMATWNRTVVGVVVFAVVSIAFGQTNPAAATSGISGHTMDFTAAVVPNPSVKLMVPGVSGTFAETTGDPDGTFRFARLPAGKYTVRIEVTGFRLVTKEVETVSGKVVDLGSVVLDVLPVESPEPEAYFDLPRTSRGLYRNVDYGFSVEIPNGLMGEGDSAPAPNHGFGIILSPGKSTLWVDASYEATPHEFGRFNARLGRLKAERKSRMENENGVQVFHESVVARGFDRQSPIIYTIQVDTTSEYREEAVRTFHALVKSFRTFPVVP
jgi:hypothetical protein